MSLLCNADILPTEPYAGRVTVYGNSNLRFTKVTRKDNGVYDCEVSSGVTSQFGEVRVTMIVLGKDLLQTLVFIHNPQRITSLP